MSESLTAGDGAGAAAETLRKASLKRALMAIVALLALTASLWLVEESELAAPEPQAAVPAADPSPAETVTAPAAVSSSSQPPPAADATSAETMPAAPEPRAAAETSPA
ncbi:hypothetical protein GO615_24685, partial [Aromatoleum evansii]|nr:hypothetical protein [Aromatoleum evansii]